MRSVKVQYVGRQKTNSFDSLLSGGIGASSQRIFLRFGLWYSNWLVFFGPKGLKLMMLWWYGVKVRRQLPVQFGYYRSSAISADRDLNSDGNVIISVCRSSQRYVLHTRSTDPHCEGNVSSPAYESRKECVILDRL